MTADVYLSLLDYFSPEFWCSRGISCYLYLKFTSLTLFFVSSAFLAHFVHVVASCPHLAYEWSHAEDITCLPKRRMSAKERHDGTGPPRLQPPHQPAARYSYRDVGGKVRCGWFVRCPESCRANPVAAAFGNAHDVTWTVETLIFSSFFFFIVLHSLETSFFCRFIYFYARVVWFEICLILTTE